MWAQLMPRCVQNVASWSAACLSFSFNFFSKRNEESKFQGILRQVKMVLLPSSLLDWTGALMRKCDLEFKLCRNSHWQHQCFTLEQSPQLSSKSQVILQRNTRSESTFYTNQIHLCDPVKFAEAWVPRTNTARPKPQSCRCDDMTSNRCLGFQQTVTVLTE